MISKKSIACGARVGICLLVLLALSAGANFRDQIKLERQLEKFDIVVAHIKSGALKPSKDGDYSLQPNATIQTTGNRVYRTYLSEDPPAFFFPVDVTEGQMAGYVYCDSLPPSIGRGRRWLEFHGANGLMLFPIDAPVSFQKAHPHWFWAEPFYS